MPQLTHSYVDADKFGHPATDSPSHSFTVITGVLEEIKLNEAALQAAFKESSGFSYWTPTLVPELCRR